MADENQPLEVRIVADDTIEEKRRGADERDRRLDRTLRRLEQLERAVALADRALARGRRGEATPQREPRGAPAAGTVVNLLSQFFTRNARLLGGVGLGIAAVGALSVLRGQRGTRGGNRGGPVNSPEFELRRQTQLLQQLVVQARTQNVSIRRLQTITASQTDPFRRGANFFAGTLNEQGTLVTRFQESAVGGLSAEGQRLQRARDSLDRTRSARSAGFTIARQRLQAILLERRAAAEQGFALDFGNRPSVSSGFGAGFRAGLDQPGTFTGGVLQSRRALNQAFANQQIDPLSTGPLGGLIQRQLAFQLQRGPGNRINPPPTIRAGTIEDYEFRVRQQYRGQARESTVRWQNEVLRLMQLLVDRGNLSEDQLYQQKLGFGRVATSVGGVR